MGLWKEMKEMKINIKKIGKILTLNIFILTGALFFTIVFNFNEEVLATFLIFYTALIVSVY